MTDLHDERLLDHEYDGISEYDNPLPGWWTWLFVLSIVFTVLYLMYFQIGVGPTVHDRYQAEVAHHVEMMLEQLGELHADNETIVEFMHKEDWMNAMSGLFAGNCGQCHLPDGGGNVGPNLTDEYYKNIKEPKDFFTVITNGVPGTGMSGWENRLSEPQRILLAAYAATLRGTTPANPKAPEGVPIPPWPAYEPPADADTPTGASDTPTEASDTPTEASGTPAEASDTPSAADDA